MADVNPPQPGPQLGPQPDFARLTQGLQQTTQGLEQTTQGLQQATTELGNFANLPPFAEGNALVQQMQQMQQQTQQQMRQMQQQMQQQMRQMQQDTQQQMREMQLDTQQNFAAVRHDIQTLRNDIRTNHRATEYNSIARLQNSAAKRPDHPLTTLRDYTANADIPGFPATPAQLANMTGVALDPILRALDLPANGTVMAKRQRVKFYIGLGELP